MELDLDRQLSTKYKSISQKARVLTEKWVHDKAFCPNCGTINIEKYPNNKPVADFTCLQCKEDYELKSKKSHFTSKIISGEYHTMIRRLQCETNPNLFLLNYNLNNFKVQNFIVIPKHFIIPEIIEKRNPLTYSAQRAGWIGCNILLKNIPQAGKIYYIKDSIVNPKENVLTQWKKTLFLRKEKEISTKSWLIDVINCIEKIGNHEFRLQDIYAFEKELSMLHPNNKHVKDKIRQQLQILRTNGYLMFLSRGLYKLL